MAPSGPARRRSCTPFWTAICRSKKWTSEDPEDYPIWGNAAWSQFRDPLANFVGARRGEIVLVRNPTEANSYIANGIDMRPQNPFLPHQLGDFPGGQNHSGGGRNMAEERSAFAAAIYKREKQA